MAIVGVWECQSRRGKGWGLITHLSEDGAPQSVGHGLICVLGVSRLRGGEGKEEKEGWREGFVSTFRRKVMESGFRSLIFTDTSRGGTDMAAGL